MLATAEKPPTFLNGLNGLDGVKTIDRGKPRPHSAKGRKCRLQADVEGQNELPIGPSEAVKA